MQPENDAPDARSRQPVPVQTTRAVNAVQKPPPVFVERDEKPRNKLVGKFWRSDKRMKSLVEHAKASCSFQSPPAWFAMPWIGVSRHDGLSHPRFHHLDEHLRRAFVAGQHVVFRQRGEERKPVQEKKPVAVVVGRTVRKPVDASRWVAVFAAFDGEDVVHDLSGGRLKFGLLARRICLALPLRERGSGIERPADKSGKRLFG